MGDRGTALEREGLSIRGVRSQLTLEGGQITIVKEATTQATPTQVVIDVRTVRGSTLETPRRGGRGWFHVACTNGSPAPVGELAASGDPYALPITSRNVGACRKLAKMIDKHVRERGLPADVGPNQGRFTSGVVVSSGVKAVVKAPMVTVPTDAPTEEPAEVADVAREAEAEQLPAEDRPVRKRATKKAAVKRPSAKKATAKKVTSKKTGTKKATGKKAAATELIDQLRELGELHAAGVLDDAEFAAAKARILG